MSRLEGSRRRLRWAREMRRAMEFEWVFSRLLFGPKVNAGTSKSAEKRGRYHLIRGGLSHGQRPPRQRLRSGPSLVLNHIASASDTRRLVWFLRSRGAFFGVGNQGREAWVAVQRREIRIVLQMERNIRSQPVVDCVAQK